MGIEFWLNRWKEGRVPFHHQTVQDDLIQFWPSVAEHQPRNILVPLCGKSLDMRWLQEQGLFVTGVDLSEIAIKSFISEQQLQVNTWQSDDIICFENNEYKLLAADIFKMDKKLITVQDAIYDRAALIALPEKLRAAYVECCLQWLKPGGIVLLKTLNYDQTQMEGPPYAVSPEEVYQLFQHCQSIVPLMRRGCQPTDSDSLHQRGISFYEDQIWLIKR